MVVWEVLDACLCIDMLQACLVVSRKFHTST